MGIFEFSPYCCCQGGNCDWFFDNFNRANSTNLGNNYINDGNWSINNNALLCSQDNAILKLDKEMPNLGKNNDDSSLSIISYYISNVNTDIPQLKVIVGADNNFNDYYYVLVTLCEYDVASENLGLIEIYDSTDTRLAFTSAYLPYKDSDDNPIVYTVYVGIGQFSYYFFPHIETPNGPRVCAAVVPNGSYELFNNTGLGSGNDYAGIGLAISTYYDTPTFGNYFGLGTQLVSGGEIKLDDYYIGRYYSEDDSKYWECVYCKPGDCTQYNFVSRRDKLAFWDMDVPDDWDDSGPLNTNVSNTKALARFNLNTADKSFTLRVRWEVFVEAEGEILFNYKDDNNTYFLRVRNFRSFKFKLTLGKRQNGNETIIQQAEESIDNELLPVQNVTICMDEGGNLQVFSANLTRFNYTDKFQIIGGDRFGIKSNTIGTGFISVYVFTLTTGIVGDIDCVECEPNDCELEHLNTVPFSFNDPDNDVYPDVLNGVWVVLPFFGIRNDTDGTLRHIASFDAPALSKIRLSIDVDVGDSIDFSISYGNVIFNFNISVQNIGGPLGKQVIFTMQGTHTSSYNFLLADFVTFTEIELHFCFQTYQSVCTVVNTSAALDNLYVLGQGLNPGQNTCIFDINNSHGITVTDWYLNEIEERDITESPLPGDNITEKFYNCECCEATPCIYLLDSLLMISSSKSASLVSGPTSIILDLHGGTDDYDFLNQLYTATTFKRGCTFSFIPLNAKLINLTLNVFDNAINSPTGVVNDVGIRVDVSILHNPGGINPQAQLLTYFLDAPRTDTNSQDETCELDNFDAYLDYNQNNNLNIPFLSAAPILGTFGKVGVPPMITVTWM